MIVYYKKYKEQISYMIFGILTTLINIITYFIVFDLLQYSNIISNITAWIGAVLFAYITNRKFVFNSKNMNTKSIIYEVSAFFSCRLLTGILDLAIMYIGVDILFLNGLIMKIFSNILVIIINYFASKKLIFKKD